MFFGVSDWLFRVIVFLPISFRTFRDEAKYVVKMASSEAAIVAAAVNMPGKNYCLKNCDVKVSTACEYKHRFDVESIVILLPMAWRTQFDEVLKR